MNESDRATDEILATVTAERDALKAEVEALWAEYDDEVLEWKRREVLLDQARELQLAATRGKR